MINNKKISYLFCLLCIFCFNVWGENSSLYKINSVTYKIKGLTREFPLSRAVFIDQKSVFLGTEEFDRYISNLQILLENIRVLETVRIESVFLPQSIDDIIPVDLTIYTEDTWNIIALPYPKYDSNEGFQLKLKVKDYNFLGSMQELSGDLTYELDNSGNPLFSSNLNFCIPFEVKGYSVDWDNDFSIDVPFENDPKINISSGFTIELPLTFTILSLGIEQGIILNDWNSDTQPYEDDPLYFYELLSLNLPLSLYTFDYFGNLSWAFSASTKTRWSIDRLTDDDLKGTDLSWGHGFSLGRIDWVGNFRKGLAFEINNNYSWNTHRREDIGASIKASFTGYRPIRSLAGVSSQLQIFYNFNDALSNDSAKNLRGIFNNRIETDIAMTLNIDLPIKTMNVNFQEITGVSWTRYIGFEMHISPFFDMALTRDSKTEKLFNVSDGWYAGGIDAIIYPKKMRSVYGRISAGFDLAELIQNGGKISQTAKRDGKPISEFFLGIGLMY